MSQYEILFGIIGFVSTILVTWGMYKAKVSELERRVEGIEDAQKSYLSQFYELNKVYVNYNHFNEVIATFKEAQRDLKSDIQKVLELLSKR